MTPNRASGGGAGGTPASYGVSLTALLGSDVDLLGDVRMDVSLRDGVTVHMTSARSPREEANHFTRLNLQLEAFASLSDAESEAQGLIAALLWLAVSKKFTLQFEYAEPGKPYRIREMGSLPMFVLTAEGRVNWPLSADEWRALVARELEPPPAWPFSRRFTVSGQPSRCRRFRPDTEDQPPEIRQLACNTSVAPDTTAAQRLSSPPVSER